MDARAVASMGAVFAIGLACAAPASGQVKSTVATAPAVAPHKPPLAKPAIKPAPRRFARSLRPAASGVLAFAGCYGRFIGWRDELSSLMLQTNSYTPWPGDRLRFDHMEQGFAASAKRDRKLTLTLQPVFKEADFPADIRRAFRAGLKTASDRFSEAGYRRVQIMVLGEPDLSPRARMAQLEANADEAFAPMAAPCERLPSP